MATMTDLQRPARYTVAHSADDAVRAPMCLCDVDPDVFRVYAFAVLAFHQERRVADGPSWCSCGVLRAECPYVRLAADILFAAVPDTGSPRGRDGRDGRDGIAVR